MHRKSHNWYREKDFFSHLSPPRITNPDNTVVEDKSKPYLQHFVLFKNRHISATLRAIYVYRYSQSKTKIEIVPAIYSEEEIQALCQDSFDKENLNITPNKRAISINIQSEFDAKTFIRFLLSLNEKYDRKEFEDNLIKDIENILFYAGSKHHVPAENPSAKQTEWFYKWRSTGQWNNEEKNPLLFYITECDWNREVFSKEIFKQKLLEHSDTNEVSSAGTDLLQFAMKIDDEDILKLALIYWANPLEARDHDYAPMSSLELAYCRNLKKTMHIMLNHCAELGFDLKPLRSNKTFSPWTNKIERPLYNVTKFKTVSRQEQLFSELQVGDSTIQLILSDVKQADLKGVFDLYQKMFAISPVIDKDLTEFYESEFTGKSKYVERILLNGKLEGINLYEIFDDLDPDCVFLHISCVFVTEQVRGKGLTNPLLFSLAFALQLLYPDKNIICLEQSISFGSANLVKNLDYFPKYTGYVDRFADLLIEHIQRKPSKLQGPLLIKKPMCCYSEIEVQNVSEEVKLNSQDQINLHKEFYEKMRDRNLNTAQDTHRGVLIIFPASEKLWLQYATLCMRMNIDPLAYVHDLAKEFAAIQSKKWNAQGKLYLPKSATLFASGKREVICADECFPKTSKLTTTGLSS